MPTASLPAGLESASPLLGKSDLAVSFSNPSLDDQPLVWVNDAFCRLIGYDRDDCVGRNCRFLQGEGTDPASVARVREGIDERRFRLTPLVNYRAGGEGFTNGLLIGPVTGGDGPPLLFGMQWDIDRTLERRRQRASSHSWGASEPGLRLAHFERLIERVVEASLGRDTTASPVAIVERLVAISRPQQYPLHERMPNWTRGRSLLSYLAEPYGPILGGRASFDDGAEILAVDVAHPIALAVHELALATRRHAERSANPARASRPDVSCSLVTRSGEPLFELAWRTRASPVEPEDDAGRATRDGLAVVAEVAKLLGGDFDVELGAGGIDAALRLPNRLHDALDGESDVERYVDDPSPSA